MLSEFKYLLIIIITISIIISIVLYFSTRGVNPPIKESFVTSLSQLEESSQLEKFINKATSEIRDKYIVYATLAVPINITDFGRSCIPWESTNNKAYSSFDFNYCSNVDNV
jgi:hypothetical protein